MIGSIEICAEDTVKRQLMAYQYTSAFDCPLYIHPQYAYWFFQRTKKRCCPKIGLVVYGTRSKHSLFIPFKI